MNRLESLKEEHRQMLEALKKGQLNEKEKLYLKELTAEIERLEKIKKAQENNPNQRILDRQKNEDIQKKIKKIEKDLDELKEQTDRIQKNIYDLVDDITYQRDIIKADDELELTAIKYAKENGNNERKTDKLEQKGPKHLKKEHSTLKQSDTLATKDDENISEKETEVLTIPTKESTIDNKQAESKPNSSEKDSQKQNDHRIVDGIDIDYVLELSRNNNREGIKALIEKEGYSHVFDAMYDEFYNKLGLETKSKDIEGYYKFIDIKNELYDENGKLKTEDDNIEEDTQEGVFEEPKASLLKKISEKWHNTKTPTKIAIIAGVIAVSGIALYALNPAARDAINSLISSFPRFSFNPKGSNPNIEKITTSQSGLKDVLQKVSNTVNNVGASMKETLSDTSNVSESLSSITSAAKESNPFDVVYSSVDSTIGLNPSEWFKHNPENLLKLFDPKTGQGIDVIPENAERLKQLLKNSETLRAAYGDAWTSNGVSGFVDLTPEQAMQIVSEKFGNLTNTITRGGITL